VQAYAEALDALEFCKLFLAEILSPKGIDLRHGADDAIRTVCESPLVTDCKSLYDAVERSLSTGLNLSEKRTSIEVLACRERMRTLDLKMRWVNSDRQLADGLTKSTAAWKLLTFQMKPTMRLVYDPDFVAAKKTKTTTDGTTIRKTRPSTTPTPSPPPQTTTTTITTNNRTKHTTKQTPINRNPVKATARRPTGTRKTTQTPPPPATKPTHHST